MARQARQQSPTGWYHLINRGADRQDTFSQEGDFVQFENLLGAVASKVGLQVHAYCLMTNHFHLVVKAPEHAVPEFMRDVTAQYSLGYNSRNGRSGPLFGGRYRSILVESEPQLAALGRYVHRNPLSIVPLGALAAYRWSSLGIYCDRRQDPVWLTTGTLNEGASPTSYQDFIEMSLPHDATDALNWARPPQPSIDDMEKLITRRYAVNTSALFEPSGRGAVDARTMAVMLAVELRLANAGQLASRYGFGSANAIRTLARRGRARLAIDEPFSRTRIGVIQSLRADPFGA